MNQEENLDFIILKYGNSTDFQISLEAWRRGLEVSYFKKSGELYYRIKSQNKTHCFYRSGLMDDEMSVLAHEICLNKEETKKYLSREKIKIPRGKRFEPHYSDDEIVRYAKLIGYPLVLKPTDGHFGIGVFSNIRDEKTLIRYLTYVRQDLKFGDIIIEERIEGDDLRVFVVGDEVVAATIRLPANITGNGKDSIKRLIKLKNTERKRNPRLSKSPIKYDMEIQDSIRSIGYTMKSIPPKGVRLNLRNKCNISAGGDSVDVTEELPMHIKHMAIQAVKAIPGLYHGGVDVLYDIKNPESSGTIIEINSQARISIHLYPSEGIPRDIPAALIDYYFPESIPNKGKNRNLFYDRRSTIYALDKDPAEEYTLPSAPEQEVVPREIIVSGVVHGVGYRKWAKNQALKLNISGFAENLRFKKVRIIVAGNNNDINTFIKLCKKGPEKARVDDVEVLDYTNPIMTGFKIKHNTLMTKALKLSKQIILCLPPSMIVSCKKIISRLRV